MTSIPPTDLTVCSGCGAITAPGKLTLHWPGSCEGGCDPEDQRPLVALPNAPLIDPVANVPNEYVKRLVGRVSADLEFLRLYAEHGHDVAAEAVCEALGHDARAGLCERCGSRVRGLVE